MQNMVQLLFKLQGEKLVRHVLMMAVGAAAAHGYALNTDSLSGLFGSLAVIGFCLAWSLFTKAPVPGEARGLMSQAADALGTQGAALLSGWLSAKGIMEDADGMTVAGVLTGLGNYGLSMKHMPDRPALGKTSGNLLALLLPFACADLLTSCDHVAVVKTPSGGYAFNTGSLGSDSDFREVTATLPDGTVIAHRVVNQRQAKSLRSAVMANAMPEIVGATAKGATTLTDAVTKAVK